jgi:hypothetical protein
VSLHIRFGEELKVIDQKWLLQTKYKKRKSESPWSDILVRAINSIYIHNSNHMEGSRLTHDQTRYIFETNTIGIEKEVLNVDDVIETANPFVPGWQRSCRQTDYV